MTHRDRAAGLLVVALWGLNYPAIRTGLDQFPPLFFAGLRFAVIAVPTVLFLPVPTIRRRWLLMYGIGFGAAQFGLLFVAIHLGLPVGVAALVQHLSVPLTVAFGVVLLGERARPGQIAGIAIALGGLAVIAWDQLGATTSVPLVLAVAASVGGAVGVIGARLAVLDGLGAERVGPLHVTLWMSAVPPLPLFCLSAAFEGTTAGPHAVASAFSGDGVPALAALTYSALGATVLGTGLWTHLMTRHTAGSIAPLALGVPFMGMLALWVGNGEVPTAVAVAGGIVTMAGAALCTRQGTEPVTDQTPRDTVSSNLHQLPRGICSSDRTGGQDN